MGQDIDAIDPRGLIRESYRIEGITGEECRSIFLDWAISVSAADDNEKQIRTLLDAYAVLHAEHPMTLVLREALVPPKRTGRRGGARGRRAGESGDAG